MHGDNKKRIICTGWGYMEIINKTSSHLQPTSSENDYIWLVIEKDVYFSHLGGVPSVLG